MTIRPGAYQPTDACPVCEGRGYDERYDSFGHVARVMCVVCSGTRKRPVERSQAAVRRAARAQNVKRSP